jgi:hypothetical protein
MNLPVKMRLRIYEILIISLCLEQKIRKGAKYICGGSIRYEDSLKVKREKKNFCYKETK